MDAVLAQASREMSSVLGFPVVLGFEDRSRSQREQSHMEAIAGIPAPREKRTILAARSPSGQSAVLADVEQGDLGYPVHIRWGNHLAYAEDRGGFEAALAELLESAWTGEQIAALGPSRRGESDEGGRDAPGA
jgi:hypothetical protein